MLVTQFQKEKGRSELNAEWSVCIGHSLFLTLSGPGGFAVTGCDCAGLMCLPGTCHDSHLDQPKHMSVFVGKFKELRIDRPFSAFCNSTAPERGHECRDCMDLRSTEYQPLWPRLRAQVWSTEGEDQTL